jgi:hypothetical protein
MEIRRAISHGANWALSLGHVPALLELIDEQQIPVDIRLIQGAGTVSFRTGTVYCRLFACSLILKAAGTSIQIDLDRLSEARAVSRAAGFSRRISLQLVAESGVAWLTITGPAMGDGLAGQVWQTVMDSLLTDNAKALGQETLVPPALPVPPGTEVAQRPEPTVRHSWRRAGPRGGIAGVGLAIGTQG